MDIFSAVNIINHVLQSVPIAICLKIKTGEKTPIFAKQIDTKSMKNKLLLFFVIVSNLVNAQWISTNGPFAGDIRSLTTFKNAIYAGTGSGVYISFNNGINWKDISIPKNTTGMSLVHNDTFVFVASIRGIFRTKDHGNNWETAISFNINEAPTKLFINENILYTSIKDTLCQSFNNGNTWQRTGLGKYAHSMTFQDSFIFAATFQGLYRSADKGNSWTKVLNQTNGMQVVKKDSLILFSTVMGVYKSYNSGNQWTYTDYGINTDVLRGLYVHNNAIWAATYKGPIKSIDNGNSWTLVGNGSGKALYNLEDYTHTDSFLIAGTSFGISVLDSINSIWMDRTSNMNSNSISVLYASDSTIYTGSLIGLSCSKDLGKKWKNIHPEGTHLIKWGDSLLAAAYKKFIFSTNGGQTWVDKPTNVINSGIRKMYSYRGKIYISTGEGVYSSNNFGNQWTLMTNGLGKDPISAFNLNDKFFAAGTEQGLYISVDNGQSWMKKNDSFSNSQDRVMGIAFKDTLIYVCTYDKIYFSNDKGNSWVNISHKLDSVFIRDIITIGKSLIVGTLGNGVYLTNDNGENWRQINQGFPENQFIENFLQTNNFLFAGSMGKGLWMRKIDEFATDIGSVASNNYINIYPNPTQGQFTIHSNNKFIGSQYNISNLLGESICTGYIFEEKSLVSLDHLPDGIYIINVGDFFEKIVLSK